MCFGWKSIPVWIVTKKYRVMTKKEFVSMSLPYGLKVLIPEYDTKGCRETVVGTVGDVYSDGSITCHDYS